MAQDKAKSRSSGSAKAARIVKTVKGRAKLAADPKYELDLAAVLADHYDRPGLEAIYRRHSVGDDYFDRVMRRVCLRAYGATVGDALTIAPNVGFRHSESMTFGKGVYIAEGAFIQGRFDGRCSIGDHTTIGPHAYLDARNLTIGEYVGWGAGAKVLGAQHTGLPANLPIIETDLEILPVVIEDWVDIGVNAVIQPGITIGKGAIVAPGAVVTEDVPAFAIVAGVPARTVGWRHQAPGKKTKKS